MASSRGKKVFLIIMICLALFFVVGVVSGLLDGSMGDKIGVIEIEGMISDSKDVNEEIVRFKEDNSIRGVIVRVNSPGGGVAATQEIYREVVKLREKKKVYVSMGSVCASGGYYIAAAGDKVYANPATITGSIGVIMEQMVVEELLRKVGLQANTIKSGAFKDVGSPFRKMNPDERAYFQGILDSMHEQFIKAVAEGRKMSVDATRKLSDGRIYTGNQAKTLGLVDTIGDFYDTVDDMKKVFNIQGKPVLVYGRKPFSIIKWFLSSMATEMANLQAASSAPFKYVW
jgi:protease IV